MSDIHSKKQLSIAKQAAGQFKTRSHTWHRIARFHHMKKKSLHVVRDRIPVYIYVYIYIYIYCSSFYKCIYIYRGIHICMYL